jgi:dolichol-phosphate mannosyltransferase
VFEEGEILPVLIDRLTRVLDELDLESEVILVDDGSKDGTARAIVGAHAADRRFVGLVLSRNFGHQVAISAGLAHTRGAAVVVMDGDLQDPPEAIAALWARFQEGYDVVYAVRASRPEGKLKRWAYSAYYRLLRRWVAIDIPLDAGDFGIMSRRVVDRLNSMPERRRFLRGLRAWVGFRQTGLPVDRSARLAGRPKFTLAKLVGLALDGLIGFGETPLRWAGGLGITAVVIAAAGFCGLGARALLSSSGFPASAAIALLLLFLGGVQLLSMAILGEYVSRIFQEVNGRPLYVVRKRVGLEPIHQSASRRRRRRSARHGSAEGASLTMP